MWFARLCPISDEVVMANSQLMVHNIQDATVVNFRQTSILDSAVIDAISRELYAIIDEQATRKLVLDFSQVKFLSSQALGVLINAKKKADAIKGVIAIAGMKPDLQRVFKIMNLQKLFSFYDTEKDALAAFDVFTV
jgi:anti-sigma B factor antagonist